MKRHINLCTHSNGSKMETVITPTEIVEFAVKDGAKAAALTDLNSVHGFQEFAKAAEKYKERGFKPIYGIQIYGMDTKNASAPRKFTLLAQNQEGLKNIYKILSLGYEKVLSQEKWPCVSYEDIQDNRSGVLVGLDCTSSDLCQLNKHDDGEALSLCRGDDGLADYIQIKPWYYYRQMVHDDSEINLDEEGIKERLYAFAADLESKLPIAVGGSNYITDQDALCCDILHWGRSSEIDEMPSRLLTTEDMLACFLPEDAANKPAASELVRKMVLDNPGAIADMIGDVSVTFPEYLPFTIDGADAKLRAACEKALHDKYGKDVPKPILARYQSELHNIISHGFASHYVLASMLAKGSRDLGYLHYLRGCAGGSFVVYLMGISETNPLPPHLYCPKCKRVEFVDAKRYPSGFDLNGFGAEPQMCSCCGERLVGDGHNIPVEFFAGGGGGRIPEFQMNFASDIQQDMVRYLEDTFGKDRIFYAGAKGTCSERIARAMVDGYCCDHKIRLNPGEIRTIVNRITRVYRTNSHHPGKFLIVPDGKEVFDFTPVGHAARSQLEAKMIPATLMEHRELPFGKIEILGHDMLSELKQMEEITGVNAKSIRLDEIDIRSFFLHDKLGGLMFHDAFFRKICDTLQPASFSDLVRIWGLAHGTNVWIHNGEKLAGAVCAPRDLIAHREDVMLDLIDHGIDRKTAFDMAKLVFNKYSTAKDLNGSQLALLREKGIPEWYIESINKIRYLFPKSAAIECMMHCLRMIWYKIHYPAAFYSVILTMNDTKFDYRILAEGEKRVRQELDFLTGGGTIDPQDQDLSTELQCNVLNLALECYEKGLRFLPADQDASDPHRFIPEGNAIRLPLDCP